MNKVISVSENVYNKLESNKVHHRECFSDVIARSLGLDIVPPAKIRKPRLKKTKKTRTE